MKSFVCMSALFLVPVLPLTCCNNDAGFAQVYAQQGQEENQPAIEWVEQSEGHWLERYLQREWLGM